MRGIGKGRELGRTLFSRSQTKPKLENKESLEQTDDFPTADSDVEADQVCGIISVVKMALKEQPMKPDQPNQPEPFPRETIPPEIVEWARQTFDEEEFLARVREIEAKGGLQLEDFIAEIEARARSK